MKRLAIFFALFATPAIAQQAQDQPSPQAQVFALQQQLAVIQSQDATAMARAYDLEQQVQALQAQNAKPKTAKDKTP